MAIVSACKPACGDKFCTTEPSALGREHINELAELLEEQKLFTAENEKFCPAERLSGEVEESTVPIKMSEALLAVTKDNKQNRYSKLHRLLLHFNSMASSSSIIVS